MAIRLVQWQCHVRPLQHFFILLDFDLFYLVFLVSIAVLDNE